MPVIIDEVSVESVPPAQTPTTHSENPPPRQPLAPNAPVALETTALLIRLHDRCERVRAH